MSRKKTWEEQCAEAEANDAARAAGHAKQAACAHWDCRPTEWWFCGKIREMTCNECGKTKWFEEEE